MKMMYVTEMKKTRLRSRPRQRLRGNTGKDIQEIAVINWRVKIRNREEWRRSLSEAMRLNSLEI